MNAEWAAPLMAELGRNSLQAAVLVLAVLLTQLALGRHLASRWRCALWLLVVVRLLVPFSVSSGASLFNLWPRSGEWFSWYLLSENGQVTIPEVSSVPVAPFASEEAPKAAPFGVSLGSISQQSITGTPDVPSIASHEARRLVAPAPYRRSSPSDEDPISEVQAGAQPAAVTAASSGAWPSWPLLLFWIWLTGVMALLGHVVISSLHLAQRFNRLQPFADPAVLALLEECCRKMGVSRRMTEHLVIVETVEVSTPALHGLLHPCLLLPRDFTRHFTPEELRFVFLHELAHLKRRDLWMGWIMAFLQALHWFNPLVWLAFARWRNDRELACDAMVLEAVGMQRKRKDLKKKE